MNTGILGLNETVEFTFVTPGPGTYHFHCILHPAEMQGTITVEEGAAIPGGGAAPAPDGENGEGGEEGDADTEEEADGDA